MRSLTIFPLVFLLASCASTEFSNIKSNTDGYKQKTAYARNIMIGSWCGEKTHIDGTFQKWIVTRFRDGTYKIDFMKRSPDGSEDKWGEYGLWGIRLPIYFTAMRGYIKNGQVQQENTDNPVYYDAYRVVELTNDNFTYQSYTSGNQFTVKRQCSE